MTLKLITISAYSHSSGMGFGTVSATVDFLLPVFWFMASAHSWSLLGVAGISYAFSHSLLADTLWSVAVGAIW